MFVFGLVFGVGVAGFVVLVFGVCFAVSI